MKKLFGPVLAAVFALSSLPAQADRNSFLAPGAYVITNITHTNYGDEINSTGVGARLGFGFGNGVSVEGGIDYLGSTEGVRLSDYSLAAVYTHALTPTFAIRGSVGAVRVKADGFGFQIKDSAPMFGLGGEVLVARNVFLLGEYRRFARDIKSDNVNLGLKLRF